MTPDASLARTRRPCSSAASSSDSTCRRRRHRRPTGGRQLTVERGDTLWDIVERHYGHVDSGLLSKVLEANPAIRDPNVILVGWTLVLPDGRRRDRAIDSAARSRCRHTRPAVDSASSTVVTVRAGDTLWDIVDRHYGGATAELVWATVAANPEIDDPNLIFAGPADHSSAAPWESGAPPVEPTERCRPLK